MLKAKKANRVIKIADEKKETYKKLGYTITTMDGEILYKPDDVKKELSELKEKLVEAEKYAENADKKLEILETENEKLKTEIENLKDKSRLADDEDGEKEKSAKTATKKIAKAE